MWTHTQAPASAGASVAGRAVVALRISTTAIGSTNAPRTRRPERCSISTSSSTITHTATLTASGRLPNGGAPSSTARTISATVWAAQPASVDSTARRWTSSWRCTRYASASPIAQM